MARDRARSDRVLAKAFEAARQRYADLGVDAEAALRALARIPISLHCWQGDDVGGFENRGVSLGGGLAVTGNYLGKARTATELRADLDFALLRIPGRHRLNLHASYGEFGDRSSDRDTVTVEAFAHWIRWAKARGLGLDFNPTFFAHPKAADGFTLSHRQRGLRRFWIEHGIRCREIGAAMGRALGKTCVTNIWIPDGYKDTPADRRAPRERLKESLDAIFAREYPRTQLLDSLEPKLFGIGSESYVVGSHEFYLGYAVSRGKLLCLDMGHYHPTEHVADKISSVLQFVPEILVHVSRGVRWDSDHVVTYTDDLQMLTREVIANGYERRVRFGLDYFDASINRVAAWIIGSRALLRALLTALLEPASRLRALEAAGDFTARLALFEELKSYPAGAVWDFYCWQQGVPAGPSWLAEVQRYETDVLAKRG